MKNKKVTLVIILIVALSLFSVTLLAFTADKENYEVLKNVLKSSERFENGTFSGQLTITDNSKLLLDVKSTGKVDHINDYASGKVIIKIEDITKSAEFYKKGQTAYFVDKDNELYYQIDNIENHHKVRDRHFRGNGTRTMNKTEEEFVDFMMGDIKEQVDLDIDNNGIKTFTIDLEENEIPAPINFMLSKAISEKDHMNRPSGNENYEEMHQLPFFEGLEEAHNNFPVLSDDVKVTHILITVKLDSKDKIVAHDFSLTFTGNDEAGEAHTTTIDGSILLSDMNSSVVDTIDLTEKDVEILDANK